MNPRHILAAAATLGVALLSVIAPATAAPPIHETETGTDVFVVEDFCGVTDLDVSFVQTFTIDRVIKKGAKGPEYYIEHFTISSVHTGPNGVSTTYTERSISKDLKLSFDAATGLLTIDTLATGNAVLYGPDGKAIARNPGQVRFHVVYDVVNDVEVSFEQTKGSTGRSDDFCAVEVPLYTA
ncbi:MAG: hypothetical protein ABIO16_01370 [Nocardioides sp.]